MKDILDLLHTGEFLDTKSFYIEFAKGSHELPTTFSQLKNKIKRIWRLRKL